MFRSNSLLRFSSLFPLLCKFRFCMWLPVCISWQFIRQ